MEISQWLSLSVALVGLVAVQVWNAVRHRQSERDRVADIHEAEVKQALDRGALEQRLTEAEEDLNNLGDRIRVIEGGISALDQGVAALGSKVGSMDRTMHKVEEKMDRMYEYLLNRKE